MKVGFGDYYPPGPGGAQDYLRMAFLECVRVNCPAVLRELRENFLPTYETIADDEGITAGEHAREALKTWGRKFGLGDAWIIDVAIETLDYWHSHPGAGDFWAYPNAGEGPLSPFEDEVKLLWDPSVEPEGEFTKRARRSLAEYRARIKDSAKRAGFRRAPERRNPEHLDWLVWWQVEKLPRRRIAERAKVSQDAVEKALKPLAKEMGLLTFRRGSTGRKKGDS